jgi:hypothetical protein
LPFLEKKEEKRKSSRAFAALMSLRHACHFGKRKEEKRREEKRREEKRREEKRREEKRREKAEGYSQHVRAIDGKFASNSATSCVNIASVTELP